MLADSGVGRLFAIVNIHYVSFSALESITAAKAPADY